MLDIENETTQFIGAVALADLPRNKARYSTHVPIVALNREIEKLNLDEPNRDGLVAAGLDAVKFTPSGDMCTADAHHVAGWSAK